MKQVGRWVLAVAMVFAGCAAGAADLEVNPYGTFLQDTAGLVSLELGFLKAKNEAGLHDVLVRLRGFLAHQAGLDGRTVLCRVVPAGRGADFRATIDGVEHCLLTSRTPWGNWRRMQVHLDGRTVDVKEIESQSGQVRPLHLVTALQAPVVKQKPEPVNPYGLAFTSQPPGLQVELAQVTEKNRDGLYDVLLRISGRQAFSAGLDRQTMRYTAVRGAYSSIRYQFEQDGKALTRLMMRPNSAGSVWELYLDGQTYRLVADPALTNETRPLHLWTAFQEKR